MSNRRKRRERTWLRWHPLGRGVDRRVPVEWVIKRATVSNQCRYCYFRIPKCANSTVIRTLARYDRSLGMAPESNSISAIKHATSGLLRARAWSLSSLARRYYCFTVVRNPYARLLSAYLDKIAAAHPGQYGYIARASGKDIGEVTFADFVSFLENGGLFTNPHWAPQHTILPIAVHALSYVGRVETLEADLRHVVEALPDLTEFTGIWSREDRRRHSAMQLGSYYTDDLAARAQRLYSDDFKLFGYEARPPNNGGSPP